jgi:hypothetical protein
MKILQRVRFYRGQAAELRALAQRAELPQDRAELAELAAEYDRLAATIERQRRPPEA